MSMGRIVARLLALKGLIHSEKQGSLGNSAMNYPSPRHPQPQISRKLLFLLALFFCPQASHAQGIEISKTVVTGSPRVVGLGGAYTSVAEGLSGLVFNPASMGNRNGWTNDWWSWDGVFGLAFQPLENTDYENDGHTNGNIERQRTLYLGLSAQINWIGLGWTRTSRHYSVPVFVQGKGSHEAEFTFVEHSIAVGFLLEQYGIALGSTAIIEQTEIAATDLNGILGGLPTGLFNQTVATAEMEGRGPAGMSGIEFGGLYRPKGKAYRLGATLRLAYNQTSSKLTNPSSFEELNITLPNVVRSPSHLRIGASYQWGSDYNQSKRWESFSIARFKPKNEAEEEIPVDETPFVEPELRPGYFLVSTDLVLIPSYLGSDTSFRGPEGFAVGRHEIAGDSWDLGFHGGIETVPIPGWIRIRFGNYYEPSRFETVSGRVHFTGGIDLAMPHRWLLEKMKLSRDIIELLSLPLIGQFYFDAAQDYLSVGLSIGIWR